MGPLHPREQARNELLRKIHGSPTMRRLRAEGENVYIPDDDSEVDDEVKPPPIAPKIVLRDNAITIARRTKREQDRAALSQPISDEDVTNIARSRVLYRPRVDCYGIDELEIAKKLYQTHTALAPRWLLDRLRVELAASTAKRRGNAKPEAHPGRTLLALRLFAFLSSKIKEALPYHSVENLCHELDVKEQHLRRARAIIGLEQIEMTINGRRRKRWNLTLPTSPDQLVAEFVMIPQAALLGNKLESVDLWMLAEAYRFVEDELVNQIGDDLRDGKPGYLDGRQRLRPRVGVASWEWALKGAPSSVGRDRRNNSFRRLLAAGYFKKDAYGFRLVPDPKYRE